MRDILDEMRGSLGLVTSLVLATACEGVGADLQITTTTATRVEVFLGHEKCRSGDGPCAPGVGWAENVAPPPGDIYLLADETPLHAIQKGNYWDVQLQAQPDYRQLVIGIAGYDDTNNVVEAAVLRNVEIPMNSAQTWDVTLLPVTKLTGGGAPTVDVPRARAWAKNTNLPACFAYQHAGADAVFTEYFVPPTDPDCDGEVAPVDCVPYWANKLDGAQGHFCSQKAGPDMPNVCTLGLTGCSGSATCTQTEKTHCLPDVVCAACGDDPLETCVSGSFGDQRLATVPHAQCGFTNSQGQWCNQGVIRLRIPSLGASCSAAKLRTLMAPLADGSAMAMTSFGGTATVTIGANTPPTSGGDCLLSVTVAGSVLASITYKDVFVLVVDYDNGRSITLPIQLAYSADSCTGYFAECTLFEMMDPLLTCTAP